MISSMIIILPLFSFKVESPVIAKEVVLALAATVELVEKPNEVPAKNVGTFPPLKNGFCPETEINFKYLLLFVD